MSIDLGQFVYCDHEDCRRREAFPVSSHAEARTAAESLGWDYVDGDDLCPQHSTGGPF